MKKIFVFFFAFALLFSLLGKASAEPESISSAALLDIVSENKGKIVIINFFATWCPPCRVEVPDLVKLQNKLDKSKVVLLGLSIDSDPAPLAPFLKEMAVNYPVYLAGPDIVGMYGVRAIPHNTIYAPSGKMIVNMPGVATESDLQEFIKTVLEAESKK